MTAPRGGVTTPKRSRKASSSVRTVRSSPRQTETDETKMDALLVEIAQDSLAKRESSARYKERLEELRAIIDIHLDAVNDDTR